MAFIPPTLGNVPWPLDATRRNSSAMRRNRIADALL